MPVSLDNSRVVYEALKSCGVEIISALPETWLVHPLPSPAPPGHLLRQFGQSDREQIQAASSDANVPQVLTMLNGFVDQKLLRSPDTVLMRAIADCRVAREKVRTAFLGILNREPSSGELATWRSDFEQDPGQATKDLVWTLLNIHEFKFIQ